MSSICGWIIGWYCAVGGAQGPGGFVFEPEVALVVYRAQHPGDSGHVERLALFALDVDLRFEVHVDRVGRQFLEVAVDVVPER